MSLLSSLFSGVTGLTAYGNAMSVIGNNIANVNTTGFKSGRPIFEDILSQNLGASSQVGRGVEMQSVDTVFQQGSFETTENITDLAIDGAGFFVVKDQTGQFYTRAGDFHFDKDGYLVNPSGLRLQGKAVDPTGLAIGSIVDISIGSSTAPPQPTGDGVIAGSGITVAANLDSRSTIPLLPFSATNANNTSNFSTSVSVFDSLGNAHLLNIYFRKAAVNSWEFHVTADGSELAGGTPGVQQEIGAGGTLDFTTDGLLNSQSVNQLTFNFSGGATPGQVIGFNFGDPITAGGTGRNGITQYGSTSAVAFQKQDGYTLGSLRNIAIDQSGRITGIFTNGQTLNLYQIFLADFKNPGGLTKQGKNMFAQSVNSGDPIIGPPGTSGKGSITSNSLEMSNVDLAAEFVKMITTQRGFTANTRVISTSDQMLTELVNLKR
ncbi:MAG: flagellar hook protein FlgE [Deltaproteobacteria bacterium]